MLETLPRQLYPWYSAHAEQIEEFFCERTFRPLCAQELELLGQIDLFPIAFTNRSGSTLLTELLHQTGLPVPPRSEILNSESVLEICREHSIGSFTDYFLRFVRGWYEDGRLGFKAGPRQLFWLARQGLLTHFRSVRIITSCRRDRLAQGISLCIARQTGAWHSRMAASAPSGPLDYDREDILGCLRDVGVTHELITYFRTVHDVPGCEVFYEDVLADPDGEVARIRRFIGVQPAPGPVDMQAVAISQQRGVDNERLYARFRREFGSLQAAPSAESGDASALPPG